MDYRREVQQIRPQRIGQFVGEIFRTELTNGDVELGGGWPETPPALTEVAGPHRAGDQNPLADGFKDKIHKEWLCFGDCGAAHGKIGEVADKGDLAARTGHFRQLSDAHLEFNGRRSGALRHFRGQSSWAWSPSLFQLVRG